MRMMIADRLFRASTLLHFWSFVCRSRMVRRRGVRRVMWSIGRAVPRWAAWVLCWFVDRLIGLPLREEATQDDV